MESQSQPSSPGPASGATTSSSAGAPGSSTSKVPKPPREVPAALKPLQFMGIPKSVLTWQPKLPSRNWSIFLLTTSTLTYLWWDDRRQCKKLMEEYKDRVRWMAEQPMQPSEWPRKITVFGTKSPGDENYDESIIFFKKYMKPILAAAGVDWEISNGTRHGGLARDLTQRIHRRRRQLAGHEEWSTSPMLAPDGTGQSPFSLEPQQVLQRELDGGIVLVGRPAMKEWFWALKAGWTPAIPSKAMDTDEVLAMELSEDPAFDETTPDNGDESGRAQEVAEDVGGDTLKDPASSLLQGRNQLPSFNPALSSIPSMAPAFLKPSIPKEGDAKLIPAPAQIPAQPPLCFVDFVDLCGWRNWPRGILGFWRRRDKVRMGGDASLRLLYGDKHSAREFEAPEGAENISAPPQGGDLDWGLPSEERYAPFFLKTSKDIVKARESYYKGLPERLLASRQIARGEREMTKQEARDPPPSESDLRVERFQKEKDWRGLQMGFDIIKPDAPVTWNPSFRGGLRVFRDDVPEAQPAKSEAM